MKNELKDILRRLKKLQMQEDEQQVLGVDGKKSVASMASMAPMLAMVAMALMVAVASLNRWSRSGLTAPAMKMVLRASVGLAEARRNTKAKGSFSTTRPLTVTAPKATFGSLPLRPIISSKNGDFSKMEIQKPDADSN